MCLHQYADDSQIYISNTAIAIDSFIVCINDIKKGRE